jgi:hypothetical protein
MRKEDLNFFRKWFSDYVKDFSSADSLIHDNIEMKIEHTAKVCENILLIAKSENIGKEGCKLAVTIALFHDLGRFEQFVKYKTFKDSESENHALLGIKILRSKGILARLSRKEKSLILKAVEYHNLKEIPGCKIDSKELLFYSKLIRDADKLDILRLISENYDEKGKVLNSALDVYLPDTTGYTESIITDILNNKMAELKDVKNLNDMRLLRLSWVFDCNFPATFSILKRHRYLDKIICSMPETEEFVIIRKHLGDYLNKAEMTFDNGVDKL